jgi:hypothetical protein
MKKIALVIILLFASVSVNAQVTGTNPKYNAIKEIVKIPDGMTYEEFRRVQRTLDWKKIFAAALIPGYIHYYAGHEDIAWKIFAFRMFGGALIGYAMYDQLRYTDGFNFAEDGLTDELEERSQRNFIIFSVGIIMNMLGYGYDWAHGDWIIEQERNEIYFKYGLDKSQKVGMMYNPDFNIVGLNYSIRL